MHIVQPESDGAEVNSLNGLTGDIILAAGTNITLGTVGNTITINGQAGGVTSFNGLTGAITLAAGTGITITPSGQTLTISGSATATLSQVSSVSTDATKSLYTMTNAVAVEFRTAGAVTAWKISDTAGLSSNLAYAKFGNALPFLAVTTGAEVWGNDNTTTGVQFGVGNRNAGASAYTFNFLNNDLSVSADSTHYAGLGYTSSVYNDNTFGTGANVANQFQLWNTDGPTTFINSKASGAYVNWLIGGTSTANESMRLTATGLAITPQVATSGSPTGLLFTGAANTTLTASTEATDINFNLARTVQFATGALATQRAIRIQAPTYGFVGASTITKAATVSITGAPIAGTNATITSGIALDISTGYSAGIGLRINLAASSTSNPFEIRNSAGTLTSYFQGANSENLVLGKNNVGLIGFGVNGDSTNRIGSYNANNSIDILATTYITFNTGAGSTERGRILSTGGWDILTTFTKYNNVTTVGWGVPAIYGYVRPAQQVNALVTLATYTVGAADGSFTVSANINVTVATASLIGVTCTYFDETNTSRSLVLNFSNIAGVFATTTTLNTAGAFEGVPLHIRAKAGTLISLATTGTVTTATYTAEGIITQIA